MPQTPCQLGLGDGLTQWFMAGVSIHVERTSWVDHRHWSPRGIN